MATGFGFVVVALRPPDLSALGPPLARDCRAVEVIHPVSGQPVRGIEDIAIDRASGHAILSAFDREKVFGATADTPPPQGGLFALSLGRLRDRLAAGDPTPTLRATSLGEVLAANRPFHPHGIDVFEEAGQRRLFIINQNVTAEHGTIQRDPAVEILELTTSEAGAPRVSRRLAERRPLGQGQPDLCSPNDLVATGGASALITHDHGHCDGFARILEDALGQRRSYILKLQGETFSKLPGRFRFANGVALGPSLFVGETRGKMIWRHEALDRAPSVFATAPGPVDNLSIGPDGGLVAAILPPLPQLALHRADIPGFEHVPSLIVRWKSPDQAGADLEVLFHDDGRLFSAATVGVAHDGLLLAGSATDAGILACRLP